MKRSYSLGLAAASLSAVLATGCAPGSRWVGLIVGDPLGVCYRQDISGTDGISLAVDLARIGDDVVHLHADWLRYEPSWQTRDLSFYWGLGVDFASWSADVHPFGQEFDRAYVAVRVPLGLEFELSPGPPGVLLFLQLVPEVPFEENAGLHLDAALGIIFGF